MTRDELTALISLGEGFTLEFKRSINDDLGRELCAFSNSTGGIVLVGIEDNGRVVGVKNHNRVNSQIQSITRSMDPSLVVDMENVGNVLCVTVPEQQGKPFSYRGRFYLRNGATSQQMTRDEIREFFHREGLIHYDETACVDYDIDHGLTMDIWSRFAEQAKISDSIDMLSALRNLHLIKDNHMTHTGAWLLTNDITQYTLQASVMCVLFRGTSSAHIIDRKEFTEDLYTIYQNCMSYLLAKLNTEFIITATGREERLELPEEALREALVNAIAHRDYRSTAKIQIHIFQDRVEIISPGGLPAGMREEDLGRRSVPRNPLLFGILFRMNLVEQVGSGITRIRELCREHDVEEPQIEVDDNWVTLVFKRKTEVPVPETAEELETRVDYEAGTKLGLSRDQVDLLLQVVDEKGIKELMEDSGRANRTKFRDQVLRPLIDAGFVEMTIPEKPRSSKQKYCLTKEGHKMLKSLLDGDK